MIRKYGEGGGDASMIQDTKVARNDFIFQHGSGRNIDPIPVVGDDDDSSLQTGSAINELTSEETF